MKKTIKFFAAALAIVAAASCAKENPNDGSQVSDQELVYKVFTATLDSDTKTTLVYGDDDNDGAYVHWTEGDKIMVIASGNEKGDEFNLISYNETFADFEGKTVDANSYRAVYPASALMTSSIGVVYPAKDYFIFASEDSKCALAHQYAVENNFSTLKDFNSSSNFAMSTSSKDNHLYFQNMNAYLKFSLAMENAASIEISASEINSAPYNDDGYQSYSSDAKLGGPIAYHLSKNKKGIVPNNGENIILRKEDGTNLLSGDDIYYYIAIPSVGMKDLQMVVKDANGKVLQQFIKSGKFTPAANTIYNLGTIEPAPVPVPKVGDYFYSDGTFSTELDKSKTAVGVVFFTGNPRDNDPALPEHCTNGLAISLTNTKTRWQGTEKFPNTTFQSYGLNNVSGKIWGYEAKNKWENLYDAKYLTIYHNNYGTIGEGLTSGWYLATNCEWQYITSNLNVLNTKLSECKGSLIEPKTNAEYWLALGYTAKYMYAIKGINEASITTGYVDGTADRYARPIFAF